MKVGFSGTRLGMTAFQLETFIECLLELKPSEFHHGCCVGADFQAHMAAKKLEIGIVAHPPINRDLAFTPTGCIIVHKPYTYLERNSHIVDASELLIATPHSMTNRTGGTWRTIQYAKDAKKKICIITPMGELEDDGNEK
jgi:hypothetical protein